MNEKNSDASSDAAFTSHILEVLESEGRIQALLLLRRVKNLGLPDAVIELEKIESTVRRFPEDPLCGAEVIAVGPWNPAIAHCLENPPSLCTKVDPSRLVATSLFEAYCVSDRAWLVHCLGVEVWRVESYHLNVDQINFSDLTELYGPDEVRAFRQLNEAGFSCYFKPEVGY